jgi:ribosomal protein S27E
LPTLDLPGDVLGMGSKSRETLFRASVRAAAERAADARRKADRLAVEAWNKRLLGFKGPAQPSPTLGDALNAGYRYLEVRCLGCDTHQTVALDIVRRAKTTPIHELERYMRCKDCSELQVVRSSAATWLRSARRRFRRRIPPRFGGRESVSTPWPGN